MQLIKKHKEGNGYQIFKTLNIPWSTKAVNPNEATKKPMTTRLPQLDVLEESHWRKKKK